ncbi:FAD/NAD(P)-binding domain-containing protein [Laetiporus sulphureus 93-53]|uniref:FAD/NAD(P)-binding domain-containing protein n=1 Tax=Laetiporus sulphureus 93-53 TaxID=1314785 RepID=A0A165FQ30_9APHY|nr:FAD/NAD(P)-binding domain-containing protein [Laetiporus sulphureus 93-53]KZT09304.1 FAD/NAD(P)-binding domain-containing protein [Laetiporus sulphureus 93-53]
MDGTFDCIVVGSGHAGSCAALSAVEAGCKRVLIVEKAPQEWVGGNGFFTAGAHRTVHSGLQDLLPIVKNVPAEAASTIDIHPYSAEEFTNDIMRLGDGQSDPALVKAVVDDSRDAIQWLADSVKVPFTVAFNRQAYLVQGRQVFWGGLALSVDNGGKGLIAAHQQALKQAGVEVWFDTPAVELIREEECVTGLVVLRDGQRTALHAKAVILACGGFESSIEQREKNLGLHWRQAKVRGTPYNTGDGISLARTLGVKLAGDYAHCHSTCWDANAPSHHGDRVLSNQFTKSGYPLGIMVNAHGRRFVDEGEDFRNYTYAKFGAEILRQPGGFVFQVWDSQVVDWLRKEEYGEGIVEKFWAESIQELSEKLSENGLEDIAAFFDTVMTYNVATKTSQIESPGREWDPAIKDGLSTHSSRHTLEPPKSNWALPLTKPPFLAVKVACGITFTFGGLAIDPETAGVISELTGKPMPGLFCTGELVGGLFYKNYPGGSGLTAGAVFGRNAGREAARIAQKA